MILACRWAQKLSIMAEKPRFRRRTVFAKKNLGFGVGFGYRNNTTNSVWYRYGAGALALTSFFFHFVLYRCPSMSVTVDIVVVVSCQVLIMCPFWAWPVVWLRPDWLTPVIQRQSAVPATSIISADVSVAGSFTLLIKIPATVTFYRATLCCLPGIIYLIIMCIGIIFR